MRKPPLLLPATIILTTLLTACSNVKVWPFGNDETTSSGAPSGAREYRCDGGKRFYVRHSGNGNSVWLILPERELNLSKASSSGEPKYTAGNTSLLLEGEQAVLAENGNILYSGCKTIQVNK